MTPEYLLGKVLSEVLSNPTIWEELFKPHHHTALDAAQDILDAADHGHISIEGARKAVGAILDDLEGKATCAERIRDYAQKALDKRLISMDQYLTLRGNLGALKPADLHTLESKLKRLVG